MENTVIIFNEHNVRILRNPKDLDSFKDKANVLINPDLSKVNSLPPHLWKQDGNKVVPMTEEEKHERHSNLKKYSDRLHHKIAEVIKHVEVVKEVPVYIERPIEKIIEVIKNVEIIKEVPVEVEKIVEVIKYIPSDVEKVITKEIEVIKNVEVIREVEKVIEKEIKFVPKLIWGIIGLQSLIILGLMLFK